MTLADIQTSGVDIQTSGRTLSDHEARNRNVVLEYYDKLIGRWDFDAAREHLGDHVIQHNPTIADGLDGLEQWVRNIPPPIAASMRHRIARVMVDGNFVMLHTRVTVPGMADTVIADIFRLEDHKVVEHWDVIQNVPETALHDNCVI